MLKMENDIKTVNEKLGELKALMENADGKGKSAASSMSKRRRKI